MQEQWKNIAGFEGKYLISNLGNIMSLKNHQGTSRKKLLSLNKWAGYPRTTLFKENKRYYYSVHRLVAEAFLPNPNNLPEVNHKDEIRTNNNVLNLEWCTREYNLNYGSSPQKISQKQKINMLASIEKGQRKRKPVRCKETNEIFKSIRDASRKYNISPSNITQCCRGKYKNAGHIEKQLLTWEYVN